MVSLTRQNLELPSALWDIDETQLETLAFDAAGTWAAGTILSRKLVTVPTSATADGGNTGDGTVTAVAAAAGDAVPLVGTYTLTCVEAVTNGGRFQLTDPNGAVVGASLEMEAGPGAATVFNVAGLLFTVTDGATNFADGDSFTIAVAADNDLKPYVESGVGGLQFPQFVMLQAVTVTGSGDVTQDVLVKGKADFNDLIIDADGDNSNVTKRVRDQLKSAGILVVDVTDLRIYDN